MHCTMYKNPTLGDEKLRENSGVVGKNLTLGDEKLPKNFGVVRKNSGVVRKIPHGCQKHVPVHGEFNLCQPVYMPEFALGFFISVYSSLDMTRCSSGPL